MAKTKLSARLAAIEVLRESGKPMQLAEIATKAFEKAPHLQGTNPRHTIRIQLIQGHLKGRVFKRTGKGKYALRPDYEAQLAHGFPLGSASGACRDRTGDLRLAKPEVASTLCC